MPFTVAADGTRIHYEVTGSPDAEPLLLIQGLGADLRGWAFQRFALGRRHRLLLVDNRGAGRSDKPSGPYDLELMAADAVAVLDAEGIDRAHVMGASMGGILSQIIAVRHAERVRSLVLVCTACRHHPWRVELLESWLQIVTEQGMRGLSRKALRWLVGPRTHRRFGLPARLVAPLALTIPAHAFASQVRAILAQSDDLRHELAGVAAPTLVIVGTQDILTPRGDSEELAEMIPGARLEVITGGAHGVMVDHAAEVNGLVLDFLAEHAGAAPSAAVGDQLSA